MRIIHVEKGQLEKKHFESVYSEKQPIIGVIQTNF